MIISNRTLETSMQTSLEHAPVIFLAGPRQAGKSTLMQQLAKKFPHMNYLTFDDITTLTAAQHDPAGFIAGLTCPVILDEIQMVPEIFRVLKQQVDNMRLLQSGQNGKFLLTGSANIMALPGLADALVGRMQIFTLYPFSVNEVLASTSNFISAIFKQNISWQKNSFAQNTVLDLIKAATFPEISLTANIKRTSWFTAYLNTLLQRDVKNIVEIEKISALPLLIKVIAARAGGLLNDASLARDAGLNVMTFRRYRTVLTQMFLIHSVPPWYKNIGKRLVKAPKLYFLDTCLLAHILGVDLDSVQQHKPELFGHILENFVASEILKQLTVIEDIAMHHYRTHDNKEVDFVLEKQNGDIVGIEVKSTMNVAISDFAGLKDLQASVGAQFIKGIVLYLGHDTIPFGNNLFAVPIHFLWSTCE